MNLSRDEIKNKIQQLESKRESLNKENLQLENEVYEKYSKNANLAYLFVRHIINSGKSPFSEKNNIISNFTSEELNYLTYYDDLYEKHYSEQEFLNKINNMDSIDKVLEYLNLSKILLTTYSNKKATIINNLIQKYSALNYEQIRNEVKIDLEKVFILEKELIQIEKNIEETYFSKFDIKKIFCDYVFIEYRKDELLSMGLVDNYGMSLIQKHIDNQNQIQNVLTEITKLDALDYELLDKEQKETGKSLLNNLDSALNSFNSDTLFQYTKNASYGKMGDNLGDFSLKILNNGQIIYSTYLFRKEEPVSIRTYTLDSKTLSLLKQTIDSKIDIINSMPNSIDTGVMDGDMQTFKFYDKKISATSINYIDIEKLKKDNFDYYSRIKDTITYNNNLLTIFDEIIKILKKGHFNLTLYKFNKQLFNFM